MASIAQRFYDLMVEKKDNKALEYQNLLHASYPILLHNQDQNLYDKLESKFSQEHVDLKLDFYDLDCQCQLFQRIMNGIDYFSFDLLIGFVDLSWLEKLLDEFNFSLKRKKAILRLFIQRTVDFYIPENVRNYNLCLQARENAEIGYSQGYYINGLLNTISALADIYLDEATEEFREKQNVSAELRDIIRNDGVDAIFEHSNLLKVFNFSEEFLEKMKSEKQKAISTKPISLEVQMLELKEENSSLLYDEIQKYMIDDEFVGIIEGEDLKKFLDLARKLYSSEKVALLKEKVVLNNKRLKNEMRIHLREKIIPEENRDYYNYLISIDLTDPIYVPYISFILKTLATIESFVDDLVNAYDEVTAELYSEEVNLLINNIKVCLPDMYNKR